MIDTVDVVGVEDGQTDHVENHQHYVQYHRADTRRKHSSADQCLQDEVHEQQQQTTEVIQVLQTTPTLNTTIGEFHILRNSNGAETRELIAQYVKSEAVCC